jgi:hypothetical protein
MKIKLSIFFFFISLIILSSLTSCKKDAVTSKIVTDTTVLNDTVTTYPIKGLWVGTYSVPANDTSYYFSFSIYPDGTAGYKSGGYNNGNPNYITYAAGTWTLNGNTFAFSGETINEIGGTQVAVNATATYDSTNGTLTNGAVSTSVSNYPWSMIKVN